MVIRSLPVNVELLPYIKPSLDFDNIPAIKKADLSTSKKSAKKRIDIDELTNEAIKKARIADSTKTIQSMIHRKSLLSDTEICNNLVSMPNTIFDMMQGILNQTRGQDELPVEFKDIVVTREVDADGNTTLNLTSKVMPVSSDKLQKQNPTQNLVVR